jgi:calcyclin binding protein
MVDPTPADLSELKKILAFGSTPYIESVLRAEVARLSALFPDAAPAAAPAPPKPAPRRKVYQAIESYAFSDGSDAARVIIADIDGLGDAVVDFSPTERAFTVTVAREAQGLPDLRLTVSPLKKIVPDGSRFAKKGRTLTIVLKKKKSAAWPKLKKTGSSVKKPKPSEEKAKDDPGAGLMDMMKKLYEEGDDDMKRTMQKAWWEAQHKKEQEAK